MSHCILNLLGEAGFSRFSDSGVYVGAVCATQPGPVHLPLCLVTSEGAAVMNPRTVSHQTQILPT